MSTVIEYSKIEEAIDNLPVEKQLDLANRIFTKHDDGLPNADELAAIREAEEDRKNGNTAAFTNLTDLEKELGI